MSTFDMLIAQYNILRDHIGRFRYHLDDAQRRTRGLADDGFDTDVTEQVDQSLQVYSSGLGQSMAALGTALKKLSQSRSATDIDQYADATADAAREVSRVSASEKFADLVEFVLGGVFAQASAPAGARMVTSALTTVVDEINDIEETVRRMVVLCDEIKNEERARSV